MEMHNVLSDRETFFVRDGVNFMYMPWWLLISNH